MVVPGQLEEDMVEVLLERQQKVEEEQLLREELGGTSVQKVTTTAGSFGQGGIGAGQSEGGGGRRWRLVWWTEVLVMQPAEAEDPVMFTPHQQPHNIHPVVY